MADSALSTEKPAMSHAEASSVVGHFVIFPFLFSWVIKLNSNIRVCLVYVFTFPFLMFVNPKVSSLPSTFFLYSVQGSLINSFKPSGPTAASCQLSSGDKVVGESAYLCHKNKDEKCS